ncbi:hypothetical protein [Roseiflexus sp. RS-1]|uniref:hypothetical protein n=1 Tax=Roseiflexus sp. (strain RS-1) TaxID=357808 RepID=UPI0012ED7DB6|nr:hypothetical protein [Roseiflexus sp. RS-1]
MKSRRAGVPPGVHLRGRFPVRCGAGDRKSRRAGVPLKGWRLEIAPRGRSAEGLAIDIAPCGRVAEGLAIGNRAARACRRASTFVDAALCAAGLAIGNCAARACR